MRVRGTVAILIDQNVLPGEAIFVPFFGRLAATTPSLALLQMKTDAAVVPAFAWPQGKGGTGSSSRSRSSRPSSNRCGRPRRADRARDRPLHGRDGGRDPPRSGRVALDAQPVADAAAGMSLEAETA